MNMNMTNVCICFHQTSPESALGIFHGGGRMLPGSIGLAGGGIYFAESAADTQRKAKHHGVLLECAVARGQSLELGPDGDPSMSRERLARLALDSVIVNRANGRELVVYESARVQVGDG